MNGKDPTEIEMTVAGTFLWNGGRRRMEQRLHRSIEGQVRDDRIHDHVQRVVLAFESLATNGMQESDDEKTHGRDDRDVGVVLGVDLFRGIDFVVRRGEVGTDGGQGLEHGHVVAKANDHEAKCGGKREVPRELGKLHFELWMPVHVVVVLVSGFGGGDDGLEWRGLLSCSQQNKNNCENKLLSGEPNLTIMPHGDFS
jgi:hypothetical protein